MDVLRVLFSITLFSTSSYLIYDLYVNGFNWYVLLAAIAGYLLTHLVWPTSKPGENHWYDMLEIIVDFPYRLIAFIGRMIIRILRGSDGDIGIDL